MKNKRMTNGWGSGGPGYLTFIVKPDCLSQGKGIFLTNNVDEVLMAANQSQATNERIVV